MSWGFANATPSASSGPELTEIFTDAIGFGTLVGESKLQLLSEPWPNDNLPPTHASLFAVASKKGLVAAAGPSALVIASTDAVREGFFADVQAKDHVKPFTPQATLSVPRVSHVAFSADESSLVIAAQEGGGLAVYDVQAVSQGKKESSFQLATHGVSLRALAPNPAPENAHLFAVVLADGRLMVADLKQGQLSAVFRDGVACVSWSSKGKQLVAGLEDGTAVQYDPQGNVKAQIPKPPQLDQQVPMTCIYWLANDDFLFVHTPVSDEPVDSTYHIMHRDKNSGSFVAQRFAADPCPAFGWRPAAHHFISRLRKFPPNLDDMLIVASTAATDVGMLTNSSEPLSSDTPVQNSFTVTSIENDSRRITLPLTQTGAKLPDGGDMDPCVIGMDLDLSAKANVPRPIPQEEMDESATPLPALMVLNHEGVLAAWWIVYNESVRQKTAYPGLVSVANPAANVGASANSAFASSPATPSFASFAKPSQPAFGTPGAPGLGKPATPSFGSSGFGGAGALGAKTSPWGAPATSSPAQNASSAPVFGSTTSLVGSSGNAAFGAPSGLGGPANKGSVWGAPAATQQPTFGQSSVPFGGAAASGPSGFAKFAASAKNENKPPSPLAGFASAAQDEKKPSPIFGGFANNQSSTSPFAQFAGEKPKTSSFGASPLASFGGGDGKKPSPLSFGQPSQPAAESKEETMEDEGEDKKEAAKPATSSFGQPPEKAEAETPKPSFSFGQPSDKAQSSALPQSTKPATSPFAASSPAVEKLKTNVFGQSIDKPQSPGSVFGQSPKQTGFMFGKPSDRPASPARQPSDKPSKLPVFGGFKLGSTFKGDGSAKDDLPAPKKDGGSMFGSSFSNLLGEATNDKESAIPIKKESEAEEPKLKDISATPASSSKQVPPPEKTTESAGKAESSAVEPEDAPLPPDFTTFKPKSQDEEDLPPIAGSPPVDLADDAAQLSPPASDEDDDESWDEDEGSEEENEGEEEEDEDEGEDEDEDEEEDEDEGDEEETTVDEAKAATTAFGSRLTFPSFQHSTGNQPKSPVPSTTPAGFPKGPFFAPPSNTQESPRSPSPIRPAPIAPAGRLASRQTAQPITVPSLKGHTRTHSRPSSAQRPASPPVPEAGELSDDEDVRVRELLASEVEPTKELEPFIAHQDYIGQVSKPGIGGQIEKVYRDINSMIDTLGLNARTLEAFVKGHETLYKQAGRERSDLEDADDWCLVETKDLEVVGKEIGDDLESGKVDGVPHKLEELAELYKDATRLRTRTAEMRKQIGARADAQQRAAHRASPLNNEAQMQQNELREGVGRVQKLLQDAEEALSILRADLAAVRTSSNGTAAQRVPTVEAVTNTIMKMTAMIEQKSGDVDVLEAQIRRLPGGIAGLSLSNDNEEMLRSSVRSVRPLERSGSPFGTPPVTRGKGASNGANPLGLSGMLGRFGSSVRRDNDDFGRSSLMLDGTPRKKMADVSADEVRRYQDRVQQRKRVLAALKQTVEKKGTRVTGVAKQ